jgi:hypothetical protein
MPAEGLQTTIPGMETIRGLDLDAIRPLARLRDPVGVLSVYADASPGEDREAAAVALRNALRRITEDEPDRTRAGAMGEALERLRGELDDLLSPRLAGRGRALFAGIAGGEIERIHVQLPLATQVVLEQTAYVRPLLAALSACAPAGIACVSHKDVRVLEWRPEQAEELGTFVVEPDTGEWRKMKGPADPRTVSGQHSAAQEDRFARRLAGERERAVAALGDPVGRLAAERGWDVLVVAGEADVASALVGAAAGQAGVDVVFDPVVIGAYAGGAEVAALCAPVVAEVRARSSLAAAEAARDAALAGGKGALGVPDTLDALAEGRVHTLLLDGARELEGSVTPDGRLYPADVIPPGISQEDLRREPHLAERMVERALETDARLVPVAGPAAEALAEHDGVAAILRW